MPPDLVAFYEAMEAFDNEHMRRWQAFDAGHPDGQGLEAHEASLRSVIAETPGSVDRLVALALACDEPVRDPEHVNASNMRFAMLRYTGSFSKIRDPMQTDALMRIESGDTDGAIDRIEELLAMSRTVAELDTSVKGYLLSISLVRAALDTLERVETRAALSPAHRARLAGAIEPQLSFYELHATPMLEGDRDRTLAIMTEEVLPGVRPTRRQQARATRILNDGYDAIIEMWPDPSASDRIAEVDDRMNERLVPDWANVSDESLLGGIHRKYHEVHQPRMRSTIERLRAGDAG